MCMFLRPRLRPYVRHAAVEEQRRDQVGSDKEGRAMKRQVALLLTILVAHGASAGNNVDNVSVLRAAADFATRSGNDVASMDVKVTFYRPSHKRPLETLPVPKEVEAAMSKDFWRVLFYVDITKSVGLRGRSM